jgi:hypothetical protein
VAVWALLALLLLGWALVTPFLLLGAFIGAFGFPSDPTKGRRIAGVFLLCALGSGVLLPWFGILVANFARHQRTAWFFTAVLILSGAMLAYDGSPILVELMRPFSA